MKTDPMHKEIQIRRKESPHSYLPTRVVAESRRKIGSIFVSRSPLRGLTTEQERKYLPQVLGVSADSPNFEATVRRFWADFVIDVPSDGVVLNIGLDDNGEPLQLDDWIKYQWAKKHRFVGESLVEMQKDPMKGFYIYDPEKESQKQNAAIQDKKVAYREFIRVTSEPETLARVLRVMGNTNPDRLSTEQQENMLAGLMETDPQRFIKVATDKDLETRELLFRMVELSVIRQIGSSFLYLDQTIGDTTEEAIHFLNNKRNSATVAEMKAKMKEFANA